MTPKDLRVRLGVMQICPGIVRSRMRGYVLRIKCIYHLRLYPQ